MFDVLIYLFETYIHNEMDMQVDQQRLTNDLTEIGFHQDDIHNALLWLEKLADYQDNKQAPLQRLNDPLSLRIYTPEESYVLDAKCRGFLLFLEQVQILDLETREMVIERVVALGRERLDLDDFKWVILMMLFNIPRCERAYQQMEELLVDVTDKVIH